MDRVSRWVRWFEGDSRAGEAELRGFTLAELRRVLGAPSDDLLYDCWPIPPGRLPDLAEFGAYPIDTGRFCYFLEADDEPDTADPSGQG